MILLDRGERPFGRSVSYRRHQIPYEAGSLGRTRRRGGRGASASQHSYDPRMSTTQQPTEVERHRDPVCGMNVRVDAAIPDGLVAEGEGHTY